jgi:hypothetical protein
MLSIPIDLAQNYETLLIKYGVPINRCLYYSNSYGTISIFALNIDWNSPKSVISRRLTKNCKAIINRNFNTLLQKP